MKKRTSRVIGAIFILIAFASWVILIKNFSPLQIIEFFGRENSYILVFLLAFIGGTSIMFPFPYYLVVFTFGAGHLNPFLLGLFAGTGIMLGDSTSYLVGYAGSEIMPRFLSKKFDKIKNWFLGLKKWVIFLFLYGYSTIMPLPNDILVVPLGMIKFPYWKAIVPLWLGNVTFNTLVALAGLYGFGFFI